jgi:hypothetical protein
VLLKIAKRTHLSVQNASDGTKERIRPVETVALIQNSKFDAQERGR